MNGLAARGRWVAGVVLVAAGVAAGWGAGVLGSRGGAAGVQRGTGPLVTVAVVRRDLSAAVPVAGTLGYAGSYVITGRGGGTLTWLPAPGRVIRQGRALYRTGNGSPVVLLYGRVPDWRALGVGVSGQDVAQLNRDLVALGDAGRAGIAAAGWDYFSWDTAYGVQRLEKRLGVVSPPGSLSLGQVVFEPGAVRVSRLTGRLGAAAAGPVLAGTSDRHVVMVALDVAMQSQVAARDRVRVVLPDGSAVAGVVAAVGSVAAASRSPGEGTAAVTVPVTVRLANPAAAGALDQAPVTVYITTGSVRNVLAVPVTALVARPGGYDVEVVAGPARARRWVPVTAGPVFDDNSGLVQVSGALAPGQRVVVAAP